MLLQWLPNVFLSKSALATSRFHKVCMLPGLRDSPSRVDSPTPYSRSEGSSLPPTA